MKRQRENLIAGTRQENRIPSRNKGQRRCLWLCKYNYIIGKVKNNAQLRFSAAHYWIENPWLDQGLRKALAMSL